MMAPGGRIDELLDRDWRTLDAVDWRVFAEAFPDEYVRLVARLEHCEAPADSQLPRQLLAERLEASVPFSAGARR